MYMECENHHKACNCREAFFYALYEATNALMAKLGADGQVSTDDSADVMDALHALDGGEYKPALVFKEKERLNMGGSRYRAASEREVKCSDCVYHQKITTGVYVGIRCRRWTTGAPIVGKNMTCDQVKEVKKRVGDE